jgi:YHS domain-containing protein
MEALVYFILWGSAIFLMMRLGCGSYVKGHGVVHTDGPARWQPPRHATDPVCARRIVVRDAKTNTFDGTVYFFCSGECREIFEAAPEAFAGNPLSPYRPLGGTPS